MRELILRLAVGLVAGLASFSAPAQDVSDDCIRQGFRPGSAAYHACVTAGQDATQGMFDPLAPETPKMRADPQAADGNAMSTSRPEDALDALDPLNAGDSSRGGSNKWNWSQPAK